MKRNSIINFVLNRSIAAIALLTVLAYCIGFYLIQNKYISYGLTYISLPPELYLVRGGLFLAIILFNISIGLFLGRYALPAILCELYDKFILNKIKNKIPWLICNLGLFCFSIISIYLFMFYKANDPWVSLTLIYLFLCAWEERYENKFKQNEDEQPSFVMSVKMKEVLYIITLVFCFLNYYNADFNKSGDPKVYFNNNKQLQYNLISVNSSEYIVFDEKQNLFIIPKNSVSSASITTKKISPE